MGIDWILDAQGKVHLLEGNGYPLVTNYKDLPTLTPKVWEEMTDIVLNIQTRPDQALPGDASFTWGSKVWKFGCIQLCGVFGLFVGLV